MDHIVVTRGKLRRFDQMNPSEHKGMRVVSEPKSLPILGSKSATSSERGKPKPCHMVHACSWANSEVNSVMKIVVNGEIVHQVHCKKRDKLGS